MQANVAQKPKRIIWFAFTVVLLSLAGYGTWFLKSPESWWYFGIPKSEVKKILVQSIKEDKDGLISLEILNSSDTKIYGDLTFNVKIISNGSFVSLDRKFKRRLSLAPYSRSTVYIDAGFKFSQRWILSNDLSNMPVDRARQVISIHDMRHDKYEEGDIKWDDPNKDMTMDFDNVKQIVSTADGYDAQENNDIAEVKVEIQ